MKITLRLYRQHDLDLIALFKNDTFSLQKAMKKALIAYVRNEPYEVEPPSVETLIGHRYKQAQMRIYLNEENESDIIEWLDKISKGYRNSLIKNIVRVYFTTPCIYPYYTAEHAENEKAFNRVKGSNRSGEVPIELPAKNARKPKKEHLTGDQIADKILKNPLKKTINPDASQTLHLPEQISIPHIKKNTQVQNQQPEYLDQSANSQVNPTHQVVPVDTQSKYVDLGQNQQMPQHYPHQTHTDYQSYQDLQNNPSEQQEPYEDDGDAMDMFDQMMEGFN